MGRGKAKAVRIKKPVKTPAQIAAERVAAKAEAIGVPAAQIARGGFAIQEVPLRDGGRVVTEKTLVNRGGTPIARWTAAGQLSETQRAAIDHCCTLWERVGSKALVMDFDKVAGCGAGSGWSQQEALDDLRRIKGYVPAKYWSVFENVCRFDEPAGYAGSALVEDRRQQADAARLMVQFVADVVAMKERLAGA